VELDLGVDVKSAKGSFTTPASTGNDSVTGVGFQPKAVMFWAVPRTDESAGSHASHFMGFSDGSNNKASSIKSEDAVNDNGRTQENQAIYLRGVDVSDTLAVATVSSFDSDGFTLNYTSTNSGYYIHYIAFGGDDLSAYVGEKVVSGSPLTGLSFAPDMMFLSTTGYTTVATDDTNGIYAFGVVNDSNHWYLGTHQGSNNTVKDGRLRDDGCLTQAYNNSITWEMTSCSLTSDGMSWTGTNTDEFNYLALNTGGQDVKVGTFFKETSGTTGATQDLSSWGFTEDAAIVGFSSAGKIDELFSDHVRATIGAYDGTNQGMITFNDANALTDSDSIQNNDYAIGIAESDASVVAAGTASQLDDDGVRITWNTNNTTAYNIGYWAIEEGKATAASGSITSPTIDYDLVSGMSSWDELSWTDDETNGDLKYQMQYWDGDSWELIPDGILSGNSTGFDTSPIDLSSLNTTTYNQVRIKANFTNSGGTAILQDWSLGWKSAAVSVTLNTDGTVAFGNVSLSAEENTLASGVDDTEIVKNNGSATENFNIKTSNATGGTQWSVGASAGSDICVVSFSTNDGGAWEVLQTVDSYETLATSVSVDGTVNLDLKIGIPTITTDYNQKSITITVQAVAP